MSMVRRMVHRYIENSRTIILAVIPANVDIATQEILTMAADVDPSGQRTLGVITKPDLVDKGAEQDVVDSIRNGLTGPVHGPRVGRLTIRALTGQFRQRSVIASPSLGRLAPKIAPRTRPLLGQLAPKIVPGTSPRTCLSLG